MPCRNRILMVDDDRDIRESVRCLLLRQGYGVKTAASLDQAVAQLRSNAFDLLIVDGVLPDGSGLDLLERMQNGGMNCCPVVFLSANSSVQDLDSAWRHGALFYFAKPMRPAVLMDAVAYLLEDLSAEEMSRIQAELTMSPDVYFSGERAACSS
ncbi:MAG: response regulator [Planctomycetota bacterium]|nr:response regulator [Planctomycetota bacterium]